MSKAGRGMDEHIRVSDADRERIVERLREHYAEGRLTSDELDERVTAALSAKNFGELRAVMTDLPEPELVGSPVGPGATGGPGGPTGPGWPGRQGWQSSPWAAAGRPMMAYRRGPRILPLVLIALVAAIAIPGARLGLPGVLQDRAALRAGHVRHGDLRRGPVPAPRSAPLAVRSRR